MSARPDPPKPSCSMCADWGTLLPRPGEKLRYCPANCRAAAKARAADTKHNASTAC